MLAGSPFSMVLVAAKV